MKDKTVKILDYFFGILLIGQIGAIIFFNLSDIRYSLDHDAANAIYYFREMLKNRTIMLSDWNPTTTLVIDTCFMFAAPIFWVVRDIFLAIGIANILMVGLYIFVISRILIHANVKRVYIWFTLCLVITPYSFGMLDYFNMLFFGITTYSVKTIVPLLFLLLMQLLGKKTFIKRTEKLEFWTVLIIYTVLLFITTFSSGFYASLCGILPIIACMILDIWADGEKTKKYNKGHLGLIAGSFIIFLFGYILHRNIFPMGTRTNLLLTKIEDYATGFRACIAGLFQLFGAVTSEDIKAMSPRGIVYGLKLGLVILLLSTFIYNIKSIFSKTDSLNLKKFLSILFLFNFILLLAADSRYSSSNTWMEYRYYIVGIVPLILLLGIQFSEWEAKWNFFQQITLKICAFLVLTILLIGNNKNVVDRWDRTTYAVELCDYFNTLDIESVFFIDDRDTSYICKGIDENHKYGAFMSETQSLDLSMCSYNQSASGSFYGNRNVLAVIVGNELADLIPAEIAVNYEYIGTVRWFNIYFSDEVYFP
ncbi:MAG: hypothetical protein J1E65_01950 [Lachnospiraceae bacterium]|nr:hypothetical protein [Lachnospiraceae bacterium]